MKKKLNRHFTATLIAILLIQACTEKPVVPDTSTTEGTPFAIIRNDAITFSESITSVELDGSHSYAPNGTSITYGWKQLSGPSDLFISNASASKAKVSNLKRGIYKIQLTITSKSGKVAMDTGNIHVLENRAPIANAGFNQTIHYPDHSTTLNAAYSSDHYDTIVKYEWKQISGPSNSLIHSPNASSTLVSNLQIGKYFFELSVFDAMNAVGKDTVEIVTVAPTITSNEALFSFQHLMEDGFWGYYVGIPNIDRFIPRGDTIKAIFIRSSGTTPWTAIPADPTLGYAPYLYNNSLVIFIDEQKFGFLVDVLVRW